MSDTLGNACHINCLAPSCRDRIKDSTEDC